MSSEDISQKIKLILCDLPSKITKTDIESFLSSYKDNITSINISEMYPQKAYVSFKTLDIANKCRYEMNQRKLQNRTIRIMRDERDFLQKNKDSKNNLYVKGIPKNKDPREIFEYFWKFGDVFSLKINEDEKDDQTKNALLTYYKEEDAKKSMDETNNKKIWNSDMEVQYRKNNDKGYNNYGYNNYNYYNRNNLKININNLPEKYTEKDIEELCKDIGKCEIIDIKNNQKGKYAIVKFSSEAQVKKAVEQLNNKEIDSKKLYVKAYNYNHKYQNYYYNTYKRGNFPPNFFYPTVNMMNNTSIPFPKYEEQYENNNLYVTNIPYTATEEDLKKTFSQFGPIKSIKLEEDKEETLQKEDKDKDKDKEKEKKKFINKSYGYVLFENVEDAKKALESLQGKQIIGFETYYKRLIIQYFIPKEKRQNMTQTPNFYNMQTPPMMYPGMQPPYMPLMMPMPMNMMQNNQFRNQQYMRYHGNMKNNDYGRKYNNNYRGRGGNRGGKNYQKRNNNNKGGNTPFNKEEKKIEFDYENYNKIENEEEKKDFLGEKLYKLIQENHIIKEKGEDNDDIIGRITGMIIAIPKEKEIINILESPSLLDERIKEGLKLLEANK